MAHFQREVTEKIQGWRVETNEGTSFVPGFVVSVPEILARDVTLTTEDDADLFEMLAGRLRDYVAGHCVQEIEVIRGYFARLSAPGYLDCTEWCAYDTLKEARESLRDD